MVDGVQIVVEEEQRERSATLDDHRPRLGCFGRLVLEEGSDHQQRERQIDGQEIGQGGEPVHHNQAMTGTSPIRCIAQAFQTPFSRPCQRSHLADKKSDQGQHRTDQQTAKQGVVDGEDRRMSRPTSCQRVTGR